MMRRLSGEESTASFERSFAYLTGAAYGLLLDEFNPDWRESVDRAADLGALLQDALWIEPPDDLTAAADARSEAYQGWMIRADEEQRRAAREALVAEYRARLVDGPVLRLPLTGRRSLSFKTPELTILPGIGRVYRTVEVRADWGLLRVESGGALSHLSTGGAPEDVVVAAPVEAEARPVTGDGWDLELAPGWTIVPDVREGDWTLRKQ